MRRLRAPPLLHLCALVWLREVGGSFQPRLTARAGLCCGRTVAPMLMNGEERGDGEDPGGNGFFGAFKGRGGVSVGDQIIAGNDWNSSSPAYGIVRAQAYELQRVYLQGIVNNEIQRVDLASTDAPPPDGCAGFTRYYVLYSQRYHANTGPVVLRPNEVQIVTVRDEIADSAWLALPGLFWVWLAFTFYQYGVDRGFIF